MLHNFHWVILHYFLQLIFRLTLLTSAAKNSRSKIMQRCSYLGHPLVLSKMSLWQMKSGLNFLADYQLIITSQRLRKVTSAVIYYFTAYPFWMPVQKFSVWITYYPQLWKYTYLETRWRVFECKVTNCSRSPSASA